MNLSIKRYHFSGGCVIIDDHCLNYFIIYNPQTPKFQVALPTLSNCLHEYYKIFTSFREKRGTNIPYVIYVVGDFNLPKINWVNLSSSQSTDMEFLDLVADLGLNQFITVPTHIKGNTLDLLFSTCDELCYSVYNTRFSDHYPVLFQVEQSNIWEPSTCSISKNTFRPDIFSQHLDPLYNLFTSYSTQNPDFISSWYGLVKNAVSLSIATKRSRRINAPFYFSSHTMHLLNQSRTNNRKMSRHPFNSALANKQKFLSQEINDSIELDKLCFADKLNLDSPNSCFKLIRSLKNGSHIPSTMKFKDVSASTDYEKANLFNKFFGSTFSPKSLYAQNQLGTQSLCLNDVNFSLANVEALLRKCPDSSSIGCDELPSFVLNNCFNLLAPAVIELFHYIFSSRKWPDCWKIAFVTPLHKSGSTNDVTNYRPISNLPKLSLVCERLLFDFIYPRVCHFIKAQQYGFMKHRNTVSQLVSYLDHVYKSIDNNTPSVSVYFDVKKAFDTVPHHVLIYKLQLFGFDNAFIELITSYLTNRKQCVKVNGMLSDVIDVTSGVPQGSVLGPLFFVIFVNDLPDEVNYSHYFMFCDDFKLYSLSISEFIQCDINSLSSWSEVNGQHFHPTKCLYLPFNSGKYNLVLQGTPLKEAQNVVDLGLTIDKNLNWGLHIDCQIAKCTRVLNFLRRNLPFGISIQRKKQLYQSCIISILLYASPCWCASIEGLRKLEKFNSRAVKWVFRSNDYVSSLVSLKLLPICFQVQRIDILLLWKIINKRVIIPHDFTYKSSCTRSGTLKLFELKHNHKFKTNDGFFPRSKRASNELIRLGVINFEMPYCLFVKRLDAYFENKLQSFSLNNSCSFYIKCFCKTCRS